MVDNQNEERYLGLVRFWRIGYAVLSAAIVAIFICVAVLLEIARQITLAINWGYAGSFWFAAWILLLSQGYLIGAWLSLQIIFGCTHPIHRQHYWRWVFTGFMVTGFFTINLFFFVQLQRYLYSPSTWLFLLNSELIFSSFYNLVMAFMIGGLSAVMWFKWLKPLTKE